MKIAFRLLLALPLAAALNAFAQVETYKIDPVHSSVAFSIRHFITQVPGDFVKFNGTLTVDRSNLEKSSAEATIDVASVDTRQSHRDADLRSNHFFDAAKFPVMTFKSTSWKQTSAKHFDVTGDLTLHGITKSVVLKVECLGFAPGMRGTQLSGWHATTTLDRRDFGVNWFQGVVGNDVNVTIDIESDLKK